MKSLIYWISGSIPPDDNVASVEIKKLVQIGDLKGYKDIWISISCNGGIGTALKLEDIGDDYLDDALLKVYGFTSLSDENIIKKMSFDEAINIYIGMKARLQATMDSPKTKEIE